jgi:hypothetical protein
MKFCNGLILKTQVYTKGYPDGPYPGIPSINTWRQYVSAVSITYFRINTGIIGNHKKVLCIDERPEALDCTGGLKVKVVTECCIVRQSWNLASECVSYS